MPGDISDPTQARDLVARAVDHLGGLDIVVNNAGKQIAVKDLEDLSDEQFADTFTTNVFAMFWITKAALPHLPPGSTIINTTSIQAYNPSPPLSTTRQQRPPSTPSPRHWPNSWPLVAFA